MKNNIEQYCKNIKQRFRTGISTEHSYRGDLQNLLQNLIKGINITNEPKDRKGRELSYDGILHYQKIIVALTETDRLMREIDKIKFIQVFLIGRLDEVLQKCMFGIFSICIPFCFTKICIEISMLVTLRLRMTSFPVQAGGVEESN